LKRGSREALKEKKTFSLLPSRKHNFIHSVGEGREIDEERERRFGLSNIFHGSC